jgi:hypothetical protein
MIKTSLFYLFVGVILGFMMVLAFRNPSLSWFLKLRSVHVHILLVGSFLQLIMGVSLWMFPRKKEPPHITGEEEGLPLYIMLNLGVLLRSFSEPWAFTKDLAYYVSLMGTGIQVISIIYFIVLIWGRVRAPKS